MKSYYYYPSCLERPQESLDYLAVVPLKMDLLPSYHTSCSDVFYRKLYNILVVRGISKIASEQLERSG